MLIQKGARTSTWLGLILTLFSLAAQAEIVKVEGKIKAFFPKGKYYTVQATESTTHLAHANQQDMTFYDVYLVKDHGDVPTEQWFRNFVKGQEFTVAGGEAHITEITHQDNNILGTFALSGKYQGMPYKKMCRLIVNPQDYATWCVSALSENANTVKAWSDFSTYSDAFTLRD